MTVTGYYDAGKTAIAAANSAYKKAFAQIGALLDQVNEQNNTAAAAMAAVQKRTSGSGATKSGTDITDLASISRDGCTLAEFTCGQVSGWMGTLNDRFVSEGVKSFTAAAADRSSRLVDGGTITIQYATWLGTDPGGWSNADTSRP